MGKNRFSPSFLLVLQYKFYNFLHSGTRGNKRIAFFYDRSVQKDDYFIQLKSVAILPPAASIYINEPSTELMVNPIG
jgi:hypothetical protein